MKYFGAVFSSFFLLLIISLPAQGALSIVAEIEPIKKVIISAEVQGVVDKIYVSLGNKVLVQQPLAVFDKKDYQLNVDLAQAKVQLGVVEKKSYKRQYDRLKTLYSSQNVSSRQLDDQRRLFDVSNAQLLVDRINLEQSKQMLRKTTITAPFNGVVSRTFAEQGQLVNLGDDVLEIVAIDKVKVVFYLLEEDYLNVDLGDPLNVEVLALDNAVYSAAVSHIAPASAGDKPGYRIEAEMLNVKGILKPGFSVRVSFPKIVESELPEVTHYE